MQRIPCFESARVLVVGDVMLDRYWHGDTGRISPEAPVPVVRIGREELRMGGAGNVALNLARLGVATTLVGVIGDDEAGRITARLCTEAGIDAHLVRSGDHPTIAKLRVISRNQQLIRLDFEEGLGEATAFDRRALRQSFDAALSDAGAVICSDYGKGTLAGVADLIAAARAAGKPVLVDPKGTDWSRYRGASLITPNLSEFEAVVGEVADDAALAARAHELRRDIELEALLVTRSERGMSLFEGDGDTHLPAQAQEVFDVTGAGDTVIALLAAGLAAGQTLPEAAQLANLGAGVVVAKLGTATVSVAELRRAARARHTSDIGILDEDGLLAHMEEARAHGERVVMTNGCFDLLHPGHVRYLEAARELGDWLVVAVNDDDSVRRLKGDDRPVNPLRHRMEVLRGLTAVDWVVPFSEDTPERLICKLRPDVLVKGGDYAPDEIAGAGCVREAGGEVRVLDFVDGYSTTDILARLGTRRDG
ncbi:bifunctional heptose 7-phosphate kinase/heptose 1-phosphate adenyltransferase [Salinisphaera sp. PC39]|uniref:bifunctional D-glycero-beta-D-manno-heptose-7-phosphate kinase/D-glycero-beta-D-manno-heptose 1-phosphate adenylyltransferase HldE n=1 Tax=Salinisphaera sp. PC39 TaxID=1304156 RepID=UPI00333F41A0